MKQTKADLVALVSTLEENLAKANKRVAQLEKAISTGQQQINSLEHALNTAPSTKEHNLFRDRAADLSQVTENVETYLSFHWVQRIFLSTAEFKSLIFSGTSTQKV